MGGSAHTWTAELDGAVAAGSPIELQLVMTKFGPPAVRVGWQLGVTE